MHVYLAARHVALSDALRAYVEKHLVEPIRSHTGLKIIRTEVQLFSEAEYGGCHVLVEIKGHHDINVRELQGNIEAAIDLAKDRVLRRLTATRDKILTQRRHPHKLGFARLGRALGWIKSHRTHEAPS
jgi:ribosome-associated translation inhibitor RaiA